MPAHRLALLVLCGGLVLSGCGGGGNKQVFGEDKPTATATATPTGTPTPTVSAYPTVGLLDATYAKALAAAGVVTAAELAGWTASARKMDATDDKGEESIKECMKLQLTPYLARDRGRSFEKDGVEVSSYADVSGSLAQADAEMQALAGFDGPRCYREFFATPGSGTVQLELAPATVAGADRVVALRVSLTGTGPAGEVSASGFQLVAQVANTQIWLDSFELTATPTFSLTRLTDLAAAAVARVKAVPQDGSTPTPTATATATSTPTATKSASPSATPTS
ncbi:MAG: hypothetical protein ACT4QG_16715 [Sporichthyaceae bacterium]